MFSVLLFFGLNVILKKNRPDAMAAACFQTSWLHQRTILLEKKSVIISYLTQTFSSDNINKTFQGRALCLSRIIPMALECHCTIHINTGEINDDVC